MCIKSKTTENQGQLQHCWRCGRILYEDLRNGHIGCRNTKCRGYLWGSKWLKEEELRPVRR